MDLNIAQIKNYEGKSINLDFEIEIPEDNGDDFVAETPVSVKGVIRNFGGTLELDAKGHCRVKFVCDRCAEEYTRDFDFDIKENFKELEYLKHDGEEDETNPDIIYFSGDVINLDEHVYSNLVVGVPSKHLCHEDCLGLCLKCGTNLNHEQCSCDTREVDHRFDVLDGLNLDD